MYSTPKKFFHRDGGIHTKLLKVWYLTVIEKKITYGFEVWYPDLNVHGIRRLISCQRQGLLTILKPYRSISNDALCILAGIVPINILLNSQWKFHDVTKRSGTIQINDMLIDGSRIMTNLPTFGFDHFRQLGNIFFDQERCDNILASSSLLVFTDGSCMEDGTGAAFVAMRNNTIVTSQRIGLHRSHSIFQAEGIAILQACRWAIQQNVVTIYILSDSYSTIQTLKRLFPSNIIIKEIFDLIVANTDKFFHFIWVKAHIGTIGNELADTLAKEAISDWDIDLSQTFPFPVSLIRKHLKGEILTNWRLAWQQSSKGRDLYNVLNIASTSFLCRRQVLIYYLSGHGSFPAFLFKIGRRDVDSCECGSRGTVIHYVFERCRFMPHHFQFDSSQTLRWNLNRILLDSANYYKLADNYNKLNELYSFIKYKFKILK